MALIAIDASRTTRKNKTGVEWYSYFLIRELLKIPSKNHYLLYSNKPLPAELLTNAVVDYKVKILNWPFKYLWTIIRMSMQIIFDRPDLLFVPAHNLPVILPKKTLITWHDIGYRRWPSYYSWLQRLSLSLGEKGLVKANKIITVSNFSKKEIMDVLGVKEDKLEVIPLAVDHDQCFVRQVSDQEKTTFKFGIKKPFFIFIGRLEEKKNIVKIIKAFNMFLNKTKSDCQLILIGNPGFGYEKIIQEINASPYKNQIIKLGWLSQEQVSCLLSATSGLIYATNYEGFGMPVLEAHAYGKRVVVSKNTASSELANANDILVDNTSEVSIANAMIDLLNNSYTMQEFNQDEYSWTETAKKTLTTINKLINN